MLIPENRILKLSLPFILIFILLTLVASNFIFFWDTVQLGSWHAHWYYENNFSKLILPNEIDSGHPPLLGMMLAVAWKIFGKNLMVSHFLMLPFLIGICYQVVRLVDHYFPKQFIIPVSAIILLDPTFLSQSILITPDIILLFFFLLALVSILKKENFILTVAVIFLGLVSMRGMMCIPVLALFKLFANFYDGKTFKQSLVNVLIIFAPSILPAISFLYWHYIETGWIGYHQNSPWQPLFQKVDATGIFKNIFILAWRLIDFGRIFLYMVFVYFLFKYRPYFLKNKIFNNFLFLVVVSISILTPLLIIHNNLIAHRYLLPIFFLFTILVCYMIIISPISGNKKKLMLGLCATALITGNLWVYPETVSTGWDSTLSHVPYYELRENLKDYLDKNQIDIDSVGADFPLDGPEKYLYLNEELHGFHSKNFLKDNYILHTNIVNDFKNEEIQLLKTKWLLIHEAEKGNVFFRLFKRP